MSPEVNVEYLGLVSGVMVDLRAEAELVREAIGCSTKLRVPRVFILGPSPRTGSALPSTYRC
jgi:hypothetical protein